MNFCQHFLSHFPSKATALLVVLLLSGSMARADITWDWTYNTTDQGSDIYNGSGILTTTSTPVDGAYTITSISGSWSFTGGLFPDPNAGNYTITGLSAPGTDVDGFTNDNLLQTSGSLLTDNGVTFTDSDGNTNNIYSLGDYYTAATDTSEDSEGIFTAVMETAPIPEPAANGFFAAVFVLLAIVIRRYRLLAT